MCHYCPVYFNCLMWSVSEALFSLPQLLPDLFPPYPPNFVFFLFLKTKKWNTRTKKAHTHYHTHTITHTHTQGHTCIHAYTQNPTLTHSCIPDTHTTEQHTHTHHSTPPTYTHNAQDKIKTIGCVLCWRTTPKHEAYPAVWLLYPVSFPWRKWIPLSKQLSRANSFLVRSGILCLFLCLVPGFCLA